MKTKKQKQKKKQLTYLPTCSELHCTCKHVLNTFHQIDFVFRSIYSIRNQSIIESKGYRFSFDILLRTSKYGAL